MADKRYQVFISSTFADLKEERGKVQQAVMELDCIPAGMELFPAIDEDQFEFIKKVIDDCDYYLLIIGGRYGSLSNEGVSYTELEYQYAVSKGIRVIAFLHKDPDSLPVSKSETDKIAREKLAAFRDEAAKGRLVRFWTEANELPGLTLSSLTRTIRTYPAIGWVRGDSVADPQIYKELSELRKENQELKQAASQNVPTATTTVENIAELSEAIVIQGTGYYHDQRGSRSKVDWQVHTTWSEVFGLIAPDLLAPQADETVGSYLAPKLSAKSDKSGHKLFENRINTIDFQTIRIQLKALGLVSLIAQGSTIIWELTGAGEQQLINIRTVRKASE